jgi:hypothetical protein
MDDLDIKSKLSEVNKETTYFNSVTLGFEQTGTRFSKNFPNNFPENQQTANVFGLCLAVSRQYNLGPWENVGHHEIQEKSDPGDEYMALIRYLYGVSSIAGMVNRSLVFGRDSNIEYFNKTKEYFIARAGQDRYNNWNNIYGMDNFIDSLNPNNSGNRIIAR